MEMGWDWGIMDVSSLCEGDFEDSLIIKGDFMGLAEGDCWVFGYFGS